MANFKNRPAFIIYVILSFLLLATALYFLKRYLPADTKDFTDTFVSVLAFVTAIGLPLYDRLFPRKLSRDYHISPQGLVAIYGARGDICIKVHIENAGEVDINIQFQWMDFMNERFLHSDIRDSTGKHIDTSIGLPARTQKDVYISFDNDKKNSRFFKEYIEALNKREPRLIESFRHEQARLTWSDVTLKMQEKSLPFGAWVIELLNRRFNS